MAATKRSRLPERRWFASPVEIRDDSNGAPRFRGHAAVFNEETDFGFMRERVAKGAFAKTIKDKADVRFLFNHDPNTVMARTTAGTLRLSEDDTGLAVEAELDESDVDVQRLLPKLRNGSVSQMSFGFTVIREQFDEPKGATPLRVLKEVELFDVSPVTFPAYAGTDAGLRVRDAYEALKREAEDRGVPVPLVFRKPGTMPELQVGPLIRAVTHSTDGLAAGDISDAARALEALLERLHDFDVDATPGEIRGAIDALRDSLRLRPVGSGTLSELRRQVEENRRVAGILSR